MASCKKFYVDVIRQGTHLPSGKTKCVFQAGVNKAYMSEFIDEMSTLSAEAKQALAEVLKEEEFAIGANRVEIQDQGSYVTLAWRFSNRRQTSVQFPFTLNDVIQLSTKWIQKVKFSSSVGWAFAENVRLSALLDPNRFRLIADPWRSLKASKKQ